MHTLSLTPIGTISTPFQTKAEAPHQPEAGAEGTITLLEGQNFEQALEDLAGMEKIWLLYWFDRNPNWKPKVLVPRGPRQKRGVFATRSPHRPNPIGLSLVDLVEVRGLKVRVRNVDLLDGTPILDIKPYLPNIEAHPDAFAGWIEEVARAGEYAVDYSDLALSQLEFLKQHGVDFRERIERILSRDPMPHPYKRIEQLEDRFVQAIRGWRIVFRVKDKLVSIEEIRSGYSSETIAKGVELSDAEAQIAFQSAFKANSL
ncbi:MAG TPA: tRNA (N6-threonylcarbamoyladenosine(37)-N6)-methyltransferase TrmO [Candidatus Kapabacteria bacterium]|jgi:tRNA-Thr(GGU) m(6)t(6)A37 methyltransferase TsaA